MTLRCARADPAVVLVARDVGARITIHVGVGERGLAIALEKLNAADALSLIISIVARSMTRNGSDQGYRRNYIHCRLTWRH